MVAEKVLMVLKRRCASFNRRCDVVFLLEWSGQSVYWWPSRLLPGVSFQKRVRGIANAMLISAIRLVNWCKITLEVGREVGKRMLALDSLQRQ